MSQIIKIPLTETQKKEVETAAEYAAEFNRLDNKIDAESENRTNAVTTLNNYIDTGFNNLEDINNTLQGRIDAEINNRKNADTNLQDILTAETQARIDGDNILQGKIDAEIENRNAAISDAQNAIMAALGDKEAAQSIKDQELREQIQNATATQSETIAGLSGTLNDAIAAHNNDLANIRADLNAEIQNRTNADTTLKTQINSVSSSANSALSTEKTARQNADANLQAQINSLTSSLNTAKNNLNTAISDETTARKNADSALQTAINNLSSSLSSEMTARATAITAVNNRIDALQEQIENLPAQQTALTPEQSSGFAQIGTVTYNGAAQSPNIQNFNSSVHVLSGDTSKTTAGTYTIYISPKSGLTWNDGTTAAKSVSWTISPKKLAKPYASTINFSYDGAAKTLQVTGYDSSTMTRTGTVSESAAGSYSVTYALKNKTNYTWADGTTSNVVINWQIGSNKLVKPTLEFADYTYSGNSVTVTINGFDSATMSKTGTESATNAGSYTVTISLKNSTAYQWADGTTSNVVLNWSIAPVTIRPDPSVNEVFVYDGAAHSPTIYYFDAATMTKTGTESATDAGNYIITFNLKNKTNYRWSDGTTDAKSHDWSINKRDITPPTIAQSSYTYTGSKITAALSGVDSNYYTAGGDTYATNAGDYTLTVSLKDTNNTRWKYPNDATADINLTWTINRARLSEEESTFVQDTELVYSGDLMYWTRGFSNALYKYYKVISGNSSTMSAGIHTVTIQPADNYVWYDGTTTEKNVTWEIKTLVIPKPTADITVFTYDGTSKAPNISGADSPFIKKVNDSKTNAIKAGDYQIKYYRNGSVVWEDGTTDMVIINWKILKATVARPTATATYFINDGTTKTLTLTNYDSSKMTQGGKISASAVGSYECTFTLKDSANYQFEGTDAQTVSILWEIGGAALPIPTVNAVPATIDADWVKTTWNFSIGNFNPDIMSYTVKNSSGYEVKNLAGVTCELYESSFFIQRNSGSTSVAMFDDWLFNSNHTGNTLSLVVSLKDKVNYQWQGGGTADKTINFAMEPFRLPCNAPVADTTIVFEDHNAHYWYEFFSEISPAKIWANSTIGVIASEIDKTNKYYSPKMYKDAGTYTEHLTPRLCATWLDGTFAEKTFNFEIAPADWSFTITDENGASYTVNTADSAPVLISADYHLYPKKPTQRFTVTNTCGGTASVTANNNYTTATKISEGVYDVTAKRNFLAAFVSKNLASVTVTPPNSNYKTAKIFTIKGMPFATLDNYPLATIAEFANAGTLLNYVDVGSEIYLPVNGEYGGVTFSNRNLTAILLNVHTTYDYVDGKYISNGKCAIFAILQEVTQDGDIQYWVPLQPPSNPPLGYWEAYWKSTGESDASTDIRNLLIGKNPELETCLKRYVASGKDSTINAVFSNYFNHLRNYNIFTKRLTYDDGSKENISYTTDYEYFAAGNRPRIVSSTRNLTTYLDFCLDNRDYDSALHGFYYVNGGTWEVKSINNGIEKPIIPVIAIGV